MGIFPPLFPPKPPTRIVISAKSPQENSAQNSICKTLNLNVLLHFSLLRMF